MDALVFDTGPLSHFAQAGRLDVLEAVVGERRAVIPQAVVQELQVGASLHDRIETILDAAWLEHRELTQDSELLKFAEFAGRLVHNERNVGDAAVLALAATMPATAVIDDGTAYRIGQQVGVACTRTLALLCEAMHSGLVTLDFVSQIADELIATDYRLPFGPGGFKNWANKNGYAG